MIKIYNSLSRKKEEFKPVQEQEVNMYACGVTPYADIHVGHARQAIVYDIIRAYFKYRGYNVNYIRNFTDVDDKIIDKANKEKKESGHISEYYIQENTKDLDSLKVHRATHEPKVTDCIPEIIEFIQKLIDKGYAYEAGGDIFFEINKYSEYGKLSNRKKEDLINSDESPNKRNSNDFVLWKSHKPGEPYWESPWSKGRPGWHIECSVMAHKYLGSEIDIHGGGLDLIFPHHENEIAQSEAYSGKKFAHYWVHNGTVMIEGAKMSKSEGNFLIVKDILTEFFPDEIRYAILAHHYNSNMDFSYELLLNARKRVYYFYKSLDKFANIANRKNEKIDINKDKLPASITNFEKKFVEYMDNDFNTPKVFSELSEAFKILNKIADSQEYSSAEKSSVFNIFFEQFNKISAVLRLFDENPKKYLAQFKRKFLQDQGVNEQYIERKIIERQKAKKEKDYTKADHIKEELLEKGISVQDLPYSTSWDIIL